MFCEKCGSEIPEGTNFCVNCGTKVKSNATSGKASNAGKEKNMLLALVLSFLLFGLGIAYAGNIKKGIALFILGLIFTFIGRTVPLCAFIGAAIWAYALYETYNEVKVANGVENPNMIEDIKSFPTPKKIGAIVAIALIALLVVGSAVGALMPKHTETSDDDFDDDYSLADSSFLGSSEDSSQSTESSSYSSDGYDTQSHYEDEHGSADLEGTVHDDGSVDAHQKGHTDYGDYEIESHMDSDGNIHGTVDVGGKTYHVDT